GLETGFDEVFLLANVCLEQRSGRARVVSEAEPQGFEIEGAAIRPATKGSIDIFRYFLPPPSRYILFPYQHTNEGAELIAEPDLRRSYPLAWAYLARQATSLRKRKGQRWYAFRRRNYDLREGMPRILVPSIGKRAAFALDQAGS